MTIKIIGIEIRDIRFPTSLELKGSDAMNKDPDYSAAYVILKTDQLGLEGHGLTFTIGRGNEICIQAIHALKPLIIGTELSEITKNMGEWWHKITGDSQLRWIGPEKGAIHLATAAIVNAVWDLWAKYEKKPVWRLIADMTPEELVSTIDFKYIKDVMTQEEAIDLLKKASPGKEERIAYLEKNGYPAYSTSAGWLGYSDEKMKNLCKELISAGWKHLKLKGGANLDDDIRRCKIVREVVGDDFKVMMDANQKWDVNEAIEWMKKLAPFNPWWIEEPTSPDDILGHAKIRQAIYPIKVATGEHCQNRIMFKQLLQAKAIDFCQIDSCRLGGINEILAVLLMAAKYNIPVCPHAGGVGLCEYVQHLSMVDYISISGSLENRVLEYVDHLHEHFIHPVSIKDGCYMPPISSGYSITMKPESIKMYQYPDGAVWKKLMEKPYEHLIAFKGLLSKNIKIQTEENKIIKSPSPT